MMEKPVIRVCGAIIRRDSRILICGRAPGTKLAGYKEFPGGKAEAVESLADCLKREIREELGTEIHVMDIVFQLPVELSDKILHLYFFRAILQKDAPEPRSMEKQSVEWLETAELDAVNMLPADLPVAALIAEAYRKIH